MLQWVPVGCGGEMGAAAVDPWEQREDASSVSNIEAEGKWGRRRD